MASKARLLRERLSRPGILRLAGAHDAVGAQLAERSGFDAVWASGLEVSAAHGVPDANILSMSDFLAAAEVMNSATALPVMADCDTGFGSSANVVHLVRRYEAAGIAAVCLEDKRFPKLNSFVEGRQELAPVPEFVGKILAVKGTQRDPDFLMVARTEALIVGAGMEEALRRARLYADAGADAVLVHSRKPTAGEIEAFCRAWDRKVPVAVVPTTYPAASTGELERMGVRIVIYANQGLRASIRAVGEVLSAIRREGSSASVEGRIAPLSEVFDLQGMPRHQQDESRFAGAGAATALIPAAGDHLDAYSMTSIASDIPMAMLDVKGKPLLQRQVETLRGAGIADIAVVTGYRQDRITVEGVRRLPNPDYATKGLAHSVFLLPSPPGPVLLAYGDLLFSRELLQTLLASTDEVTLLVDRAMPPERRDDPVKMDRVTLDPPPSAGRSLKPRTRARVVRIGKQIPPEGTHAEYVGLALFSAAAYRGLRERYLASLPAGGKASINDVLQAAIDGGLEVSAVEVNGGWLEIHSFEDYRRACREAT